MDSKYQVILADPPWWYQNRKTGGERKNKAKFGGGARKHYPLMKDAELLAMRPFIDSLADENALLFMWATAPRMDFATDLVKAWGFIYCTIWSTWIKTTKNAGFIYPAIGNGLIYGGGSYTASNPEFVLVGRKGKALQQARAMTPSVFFAPRQERHSQKPEQIQEKIDFLYPDARKIELFARRPYSGWDCWGNEVGHPFTECPANQAFYCRDCREVGS